MSVEDLINVCTEYMKDCLRVSLIAFCLEFAVETAVEIFKSIS